MDGKQQFFCVFFMLLIIFAEIKNNKRGYPALDIPFTYIDYK
jgi:hypothetical protein